MKITGQDKALMITFGGASFLLLVFILITIKPYDHAAAEKEQFIPIPVIEEIELPEEEQELTEQEESQEPISHLAQNSDRLRREAEMYFNQSESPENAANTQEETESAVEEVETNNDGIDYKKKLEELRQKAKETSTGNEKASKETAQTSTTTSHRSTVSYQLKDRNAVRIPNPVYTCDATGKVVINIEVNDGGGVVKTSVNKSASTTSNGCLIDQAINYAKRAYFNKADRATQLGTITFEFQG